MSLSGQTASKILCHHLCWPLWTWSWMGEILSPILPPHKLPLQAPSSWYSTMWNIHGKWSHQAQCITTAAKRPHCHSTWLWRSMLLPEVEGWWTQSTVWECAFPMTGGYASHQTLPMVSVNISRLKLLCVHQSCTRNSSQQKQWTILIITQALQQPKILSMALAFLFSSTHNMSMVASTTVYQ